jgi:hypothetical protein
MATLNPHAADPRVSHLWHSRTTPAVAPHRTAQGDNSSNWIIDVRALTHA